MSDFGTSFARSFGLEAARYARVRPSYPVDAVEHALAALPGPGRPQRILDLGAGTGKLTELLIGRAAEVVAVEPDEQMLAQLTDRVPGARLLHGSAEQIDLPDASVDAILVGQAFHWFSRPAADREMARVLRPGGVAAMLWNFPDREIDWVRKLDEATGRPSDSSTPPPADLDPALFTDPDLRWLDSAHELAGPAALQDLAQTWSWVITRPAAERELIANRLRILINQHAQLQGPVVRLPQRTKVIRQHRRSAQVLRS